MSAIRDQVGRVRARILQWRTKPEGRRGIRKLGHREYVGGLWDEMGRLQFDFLVAQGLKPKDVLLDIGCGSLRGGIHFIDYLEVGNYLGMEKEVDLLRLGVSEELHPEVYRAKRPELIASGSFEFERFSKRPNFALAQSLFTHLTAEPIDLCMERLRVFVESGCRCFATFFEGDNSSRPRSHDHRISFYPREEMEEFGERHGWATHYIGDWDHPRGQVMVEYVAR
jgi:hypothetical protein